MRDDLLFRAAWTNTIGRPSYEQNVPFRIFEIEEDDEDVFEGAIEAGNSDLDPLESMNFDVTLEWYLEPAGLLSAGVFYKDIENPIFTRITDAGGRGVRGPLHSRTGNRAAAERAIRRDHRRRARLPAAVHASCPAG